jgi:hypothetical protein
LPNILPVGRDPSPHTQHHHVGTDCPGAGLHCLDLATPDVIAGDLDTGDDVDAIAPAHLFQTTDRLDSSRISGELFVDGHVDGVMLEVGPNPGEKIAGLLTNVEI